MIQAIIAAEAMSLIICAIVFYGNIFEASQKNDRRDCYTALTVVLAIAMTSDLVSWALDGSTEHPLALSVSTFLSTILCFAVAICFVLYFYLYIREKRDIMFAPFGAAIAYSAIAMVVTAVVSAKGMLYTFDNGVYVEGEWYGSYLIANGFMIAFVFVVICMSAKHLGVHDCIAALSYIIIPVISMCINGYNEDLAMTYPAITISMLLVYIMMQAEHENILAEKEYIQSQQIIHDELTGLLNRRAYTEKIEEMKRSKGSVGVIYCDINCLKFTNDNFGHEAGDKLIVDFAKVLKDHFRKESAFRISGDEFVIILPNIPVGSLYDRMRVVASHISAYDVPMAAVGAACGKTEDVFELIMEAEKNMYEDKQRFYDENPKYGR